MDEERKTARDPAAEENSAADAEPAAEDAIAPAQPDNLPDAKEAGQMFIAAIHAKMSKLVGEFAGGHINRTQFHHIYDRYQRQIMTVAQMITESDPEAWRDAVSESEDTYHIKERLTARALGMSVYDNSSGIPIDTLGEFTVDPGLIVPMLSSYRAATAEIFRAGMRSTEMENGHWLCFVPGRFTTLIALFSLEPSEQQLSTIERLHQDFELANKAELEKDQVDPEALVYPFRTFVRKVKNASEIDDLYDDDPFVD